MRHPPSLMTNLHKRHFHLRNPTTSSSLLSLHTKTQHKHPLRIRNFSIAFPRLQTQQPRASDKSNPSKPTGQPSHGPDLGQPSFSFLRDASPLVRWTVIVAISIIGTAETYTYGKWGWGKWKRWRDGQVEKREGVENEDGRKTGVESV